MESLNNSVLLSTTKNGYPPFVFNSNPMAGWGWGGRRRGLKKVMRRAEAEDKNYEYAGGKLVEESMIVLRKRIHEIKMAERRQEAPSDWLEWEKRFYTNYDSHICEALGYLQSHLMNTRPSVTFAILALLTLSIPISSAFLLHCFFQILPRIPLPLP